MLYPTEMCPVYVSTQIMEMIRYKYERTTCDSYNVGCFKYVSQTYLNFRSSGSIANATQDSFIDKYWFQSCVQILMWNKGRRVCSLICRIYFSYIAANDALVSHICLWIDKEFIKTNRWKHFKKKIIYLVYFYTIFHDLFHLFIFLFHCHQNRIRN